MPIRFFEGDLIRLRSFEFADWELHYHWDRADSDPGRLTDEVWFPNSLEHAKVWAEAEAKRQGQNDEYRFQIETLDGQFVGTINTHHCNLRCGTFMYGL